MFNPTPRPPPDIAGTVLVWQRQSRRPDSPRRSQVRRESYLPPRAPRTPVPRRALPNGRQICLSNSQVVERGRAGDTGTPNRCTRRLISAARVSPVGRYPGPGQPVKRRHVMWSYGGGARAASVRHLPCCLPSSGPENGPRVEELRGLITKGPVGHRSGRGGSRNKVRVFCNLNQFSKNPEQPRSNYTGTEGRSV